MVRRSFLARFRAVAPGRRRLIAEAAVALTAARLAIRFRPFRKAVTMGSGGRKLRDAASPAQLASAVRSASANLPWTSVCFPEGLALQRMLRRRGYDARLHYGVGKAKGEVLKAHVWVTLDGATLIGADSEPYYREVASYP